MALAVSDPSSPLYGQHLTNDQIAAIIAPPMPEILQLAQEVQSTFVLFFPI